MISSRNAWFIPGANIFTPHWQTFAIPAILFNGNRVKCVQIVVSWSFMCWVMLELHRALCTLLMVLDPLLFSMLRPHLFLSLLCVSSDIRTRITESSWYYFRMWFWIYICDKTCCTMKNYVFSDGVCISFYQKFVFLPQAFQWLLLLRKVIVFVSICYKKKCVSIFPLCTSTIHRMFRTSPCF